MPTYDSSVAFTATSLLPSASSEPSKATLDSFSLLDSLGHHSRTRFHRIHSDFPVALAPSRLKFEDTTSRSRYHGHFTSLILEAGGLSSCAANLGSFAKLARKNIDLLPPVPILPPPEKWEKVKGKMVLVAHIDADYNFVYDALMKRLSLPSLGSIAWNCGLRDFTYLSTFLFGVYGEVALRRAIEMHGPLLSRWYAAPLPVKDAPVVLDPAPSATSTFPTFGPPANYETSTSFRIKSCTPFFMFLKNVGQRFPVTEEVQTKVYTLVTELEEGLRFIRARHPSMPMPPDGFLITSPHSRIPYAAGVATAPNGKKFTLNYDFSECTPHLNGPVLSFLSAKGAVSVLPFLVPGIPAVTLSYYPNSLESLPFCTDPSKLLGEVLDKLIDECTEAQRRMVDPFDVVPEKVSCQFGTDSVSMDFDRKDLVLALCTMHCAPGPVITSIADILPAVQRRLQQLDELRSLTFYKPVRSVSASMYNSLYNDLVGSRKKDNALHIKATTRLEGILSDYRYAQADSAADRMLDRMSSVPSDRRKMAALEDASTVVEVPSLPPAPPPAPDVPSVRVRLAPAVEPDADGFIPAAPRRGKRVLPVVTPHMLSAAVKHVTNRVLSPPIASLIAPITEAPLLSSSSLVAETAQRASSTPSLPPPPAEEVEAVVPAPAEQAPPDPARPANLEDVPHDVMSHLTRLYTVFVDFFSSAAQGASFPAYVCEPLWGIFRSFSSFATSLIANVPLVGDFIASLARSSLASLASFADTLRCLYATLLVSYTVSPDVVEYFVFSYRGFSARIPMADKNTVIFNHATYSIPVFCLALTTPGRYEDIDDDLLREYGAQILSTTSSVVPALFTRGPTPQYTQLLRGVVLMSQAISACQLILQFFKVYIARPVLSALGVQRIDTVKGVVDQIHTLVAEGNTLAVDSTDVVQKGPDWVAKARDFQSRALALGLTVQSCLPLGELNRVYSKVMSNYAQAHKVQSEPTLIPERVFCIIAGAPGCGKDLLISALTSALTVHPGYDPTSEPVSVSRVYTRDPNKEYWDGFTSATEAIVIQDLFQQTDQTIRATLANWLITSCSSMIHPVELAGVDGKHMLMKHRFLIASTNLAAGHAMSFGVQDSRAISRRIDLRVELNSPGAARPLKIVSVGDSSGLDPGIVGRQITSGELAYFLNFSEKYKCEFYSRQRSHHIVPTCPEFSYARSSAQAPPEPEPVPLTEPGGVSAHMRSTAVPLGLGAGVLFGSATIAAIAGYALGSTARTYLTGFFSKITAMENRISEIAASLIAIATSGTRISAAVAAVEELFQSVKQYMTFANLKQEVTRAAKFLYSKLFPITGIVIAMFGLGYFMMRKSQPHGSPFVVYDPKDKKRNKVELGVDLIKRWFMSRAVPQSTFDNGPILEKLKKNILKFEVSLPNRGSGGCDSLFVDPRHVLIPAHTLVPDAESRDSLDCATQGILSFGSDTFRICEVSFARVYGYTNDLIMVELPRSIPSIKDIVSLFCESNPATTKAVRVDSLGDVVDLRDFGCATHCDYHLNGSQFRNQKVYRSSTSSAPGKCMDPVFDLEAGRIIGVHIAGDSVGYSYAIPLNQEVVKGMLAVLVTTTAHSVPLPNPISPGEPVLPVESIHPSLRPKRCISFSTDLHRTPCFTAKATPLAQKFGVKLKVPASANIPDRRLGGIQLFPQLDRPTSVLQGVDPAFFDEFASLVYPAQLAGKFPRSSVEYAISTMSLDKSPGPPWTSSGFTSKSDVLVRAPQKLREAVDSLLRNSASSKDYELLVTTFTKDELLRVGKNPRTIDAFSMEAHIAVMAVFLPLRKALLERHADPKSRFAPGVNPYSNVWAKFYKRFFRDDRNVFAYDCTNLDRSLATDLIRTLARIIAEQIEPPKPGDPVSEASVEFLISMVCNCWRLIDSHGYKCVMGNVSGGPATVEINCGALCILFALVFFLIVRESMPQATLTEVFALVDWTLFGDDSLGCADKSINLDKFAPMLARYGITMTFPDKLPHDPGYVIPHEEVTFLKRFFKKVTVPVALAMHPKFVEIPLATEFPSSEGFVTVVLAPLEVSSIVNSVAYYKDPATYPDRAFSALHEACLHSEDLFNSVAEVVLANLTKMSAAFAPSGVLRKFPTYDELYSIHISMAARPPRSAVHDPDEVDDLLMGSPIRCGSDIVPHMMSNPQPTDGASSLSTAWTAIPMSTEPEVPAPREPIAQRLPLPQVRPPPVSRCAEIAGWYLFALILFLPLVVHAFPSGNLRPVVAYVISFLIQYYLGVNKFPWQFRFFMFVLTIIETAAASPLSPPRDFNYSTHSNLVCVFATETTTQLSTIDTSATLASAEVEVMTQVQPLPSGCASLFKPLAPCHPDAPLAILSRWYQLPSFTWDGGAVPPNSFASFGFPDALFSLGPIARALENFRYFRAGVEVEFRCEGNTFTYGSVLLQPIPNYDMMYQKGYAANIWAAATAPHITLDADQSNNAVVSIPYSRPEPWFDLAFYPTSGIGAIIAYPLVPLATVGGTVSPVLTVTVHARFTDISLNGPTDVPYTIAQRPWPPVHPSSVEDPVHESGGAAAFPSLRKKPVRIFTPHMLAHPTKEQAQKSAMNMLTTGILTVARTVMDLVPRPLATAAGLVAYYTGFNKPSSVRAPAMTMQTLCPDLTASDGLSQAIVLSRIPAAEPTAFTNMSDIDEHDIASYASRPGIICQTTIDSTTSVGNLLMIPINPRYAMYETDDAGVGIVFPTPASFMTTPFALWRGTMAYKFYFSASSFHRLKLQIAVVYGHDINADPTPTTLDSSHSVIVDVTGRTEYSFTVPFIHTRPWARNSIGAIFVNLLTPSAPISGAVDAPVYVTVYTSARADLEVSEPGVFKYLNLQQCQPGSVGHMTPSDDFKTSFTPILAGDTVKLGTGVLTRDPIRSISDVLRQPTPWLDYTAGAVGLQDVILVVSPHSEPSFQLTNVTAYAGAAGYISGGLANGYQPSASIPVSFAVIPLPLSTSLGTGQLVPTPTMLDHFLNGYLFHHGGMRMYLSVRSWGGAHPLTIRPVPLSAEGAFTTYATTGLPLLNFPNVALWDHSAVGGIDLPTGIESTGFGTVGSDGSSSNGTLVMREFEMPYRSNNAFYSTYRLTPTDNSVLPQAPFTNSDVCSMVHLKIPATDSKVLRVFRSIADDFRFFGAAPLPPVYLIMTMGYTPGYESSATRLVYAVNTAHASALWRSVSYW
jgi:hypothetical protein